MNKNSYKKQFTTEEKKAYFENLTNNIVKQFFDAFESGQITEAISFNYLKKLENIPSDKWSFRNKILMYLKNTNDARGFDQWSSVGRKIKAGHKAFYILGPVLVEKKKLKKYADKLHLMTEEEKNEKELVNFKPIPVYRYEDTERLNDNFPIDLKYIEEPVFLPTFQKIAENLNIELTLKTSHHGEGGSYIPAQKKIELASGDPIVFFHEVTHHIHGLIENLKGGQDTRQEVIAQFTASILCEIYGFQEYKNLGFTLKYIKEYMKETDNKKIVKNITELLNIVKKIIDIALEKVKPEIVLTVK